MSAKERLEGAHFVQIIQSMSAAINAQKEMLSALDASVGDGDHGVNMAAALNAAAGQVSKMNAADPAEVWLAAGTTLMNEMGGASGLIFGTFFWGGGQAIAGKKAVDGEEIGILLEQGLVQVQQRGQAQIGDKTMVDALAPAVGAYRDALAADVGLAAALQQAAQRAMEGAEATKEMVARFGRARFVGQRAIGHQDAGATSIAIMLSAWADTVRRQLATEEQKEKAHEPNATTQHE